MSFSQLFQHLLFPQCSTFRELPNNNNRDFFQETLNNIVFFAQHDAWHHQKQRVKQAAASTFVKMD